MKCECHLCPMCRRLTIGRACECYEPFTKACCVTWHNKTLFIAMFESLQLVRYFRPNNSPEIISKSSTQLCRDTMWSREMKILTLCDNPTTSAFFPCTHIDPSTPTIWALAAFFDEEEIIKVTFHDSPESTLISKCTIHCWVELAPSDEDRVLQIEWT